MLDVAGDGAGATVRTTAGDIDAEFVVNAAGPYARELAGKAGVDLPVTLAQAQSRLHRSGCRVFPLSIPMCVDNDTGVLIRREGAGFLIGFSDPG